MNGHKNENGPEIPEYGALLSQESPRSILEKRVLAELHNQGLLHTKRNALSIWKMAAAVAACVILFAGGAIFEKQWPARVPDSVSMSEKTFVLFLVEDSDYHAARSETEERERIELYRSWAGDLRKKGVTVDGTKLHEGIHIVEANPNGAIRNGSNIAGYFLVDANNLNEALNIARTCPHLRFGGRIEVRQVQSV